MVVKVALLYELWTSLFDLCWIIFLFSDLITKQALILLHTDKLEEAPNKILRRLPARSLFYYKCVCRSYNGLISDYNNHNVLPWTLASFFYDTHQGHQHYTSITDEHPYLPFTLVNVVVSDIYNGLILCWCRGANGFIPLCRLQSGNQEV